MRMKTWTSGRAAVLGRWWRGLSWRTRERALGSLAALLLAAALVSTWEGPPFAAGPDDAVRAYLEALRAHDVEKALTLVRHHPEGESARFLTPATLGADWTVSSVEVAENGDRTARVAVTLTAFGRSQSGSFSLTKAPDGTWAILDPLVAARIGDTPLRYLDLNGALLGWEITDPAREYLLFPGAYRIYPTGNALTAAPVEILALNGSTPVTLSPTSTALTEQGAASARAAVESYVETCATAGDLTPVNCPFAAARDIGDYLGYELLRDHRDVRWTVTKQPVMEFAVDGPVVWVRDVEPGEVELSMTATEYRWNGDDWVPDREVEEKTTCQIQARWLTLTLVAGGSWQVRHVADPGPAPGPLNYRPGITLDTCGRGKS